MRITGGPELKARLVAASNSGPDIQAEWAQIAARDMARTAPRRTGALSRSIRPGVQGTKAVVRGAYWGIFIDRGTKAHVIEPRDKQALKFQYRGTTVFAKKSHRRRKARKPFITEAAQKALQEPSVSAPIILAWNRRRAGSGFRKIN